MIFLCIHTHLIYILNSFLQEPSFEDGMMSEAARNELETYKDHLLSRQEATRRRGQDRSGEGEQHKRKRQSSDNNAKRRRKESNNNNINNDTSTTVTGPTNLTGSPIIIPLHFLHPSFRQLANVIPTIAMSQTTQGSSVSQPAPPLCSTPPTSVVSPQQLLHEDASTDNIDIEMIEESGSGIVEGCIVSSPSKTPISIALASAHSVLESSFATIQQDSH